MSVISDLHRSNRVEVFSEPWDSHYGCPDCSKTGVLGNSRCVIHKMAMAVGRGSVKPRTIMRQNSEEETTFEILQEMC